MADIAPVIRHRFFDANGDPLSGGLLYTYLGGTTTPLGTYTDAAESASNTNPIVLDSEGYCDLWLGSGTYKFVLQNSSGVTQWTKDNITAEGVDLAESSAFTEHSVTAGQSATALSGETWTSADYTSVVYDFEIIRGTTINANGSFAAQLQNSTWRIKLGAYVGDVHGITFSLTGTTTQQLNAAANAGDNGTIKLSRRLVPA